MRISKTSQPCAPVNVKSFCWKMLAGEILLKLARDIPAYIFPPGISHLWGVGQLKIPYKRV